MSLQNPDNTVVLHKREQLLRILGPPKVQVSKCYKKFQSGDRSLLIIHEIWHFSMQISHNFFQNFWCSTYCKIHNLPFKFY